MPDEIENDEPKLEVQLEGDAVDPMRPIINGGEGPQREDERSRAREPRRDGNARERDTSRRVEDDGDEGYSQRVQRRIAQYRRRAGEAEATRDHAVAENRRLLSELGQVSEASLAHYEQASLARLEFAKREAQDAYDSGDGQRVVEANRKLASAQGAIDQVEAAKARKAQEKPQREQAQEEPAQRQQRAQFTPRTQKWVDQNPWFEDDADARAQALKVHDRLRREGYEIESDDYFNELTRRSKVLFPEHFEDGEGRGTRRSRVVDDELGDDEDAVADAEDEPPPKRRAAVAAVTRTASPAAKTKAGVQVVKLSDAQREAAQIAGVSPKQYAEDLVRLRANGKLR